MAALDRALDFGDDYVNLAHVGNDRHRHIAVADLAPLRQGIVIRLHAGELELGIGLKKGKIRHRAVGIEHLAVDAIFIQRF